MYSDIEKSKYDEELGKIRPQIRGISSVWESAAFARRRPRVRAPYAPLAGNGQMIIDN